MFTPSKRTNRAQIKAYLGMLNDCALITNKQKQNKMATNDTATQATQATDNNTATQATDNNGAFSFASTFNGGHVFDVDTSNFEFCKLETLYTALPTADLPAVFKLDGLWVNEGKYGRQGVLIVAELGKLVNAPMHYTTVFDGILNNAAAVNAIKAGKVGFTVYTYVARNRKCYGIRFVDIE